MIATAILGLIVDLVAVRPVSKDYPLASLISTIGVTIVLQNLAIYIFGGEQVGFPEKIEPVLYRLGPVTISSVQIFILVVALVLMVVLWLFINRTKLGRAMRATAESHETAALLGVNVNGVVMFTFVLASALAGVAGVLEGAVNHPVLTEQDGLDVRGVRDDGDDDVRGLGDLPGRRLGGTAGVDHLPGLLRGPVVDVQGETALRGD